MGSYLLSTQSWGQCKKCGGDQPDPALPEIISQELGGLVMSEFQGSLSEGGLSLD